MSEKDIEDLRWALHLRADLIALSFVRSADDVDDVREIMDEEGEWLPVIAKIEKPQAIDHIDEIIAAFDGVMVARGDLGVEMPLEDVPFLQKQIVEAARRNAKPAIVATQMLESMISCAAPDPGRGVRRRQRRARRRGRGDAVGGDERRGVPDRDGRDDGPDHRVDRGPRAGPDGRDRLAAAHPRRRHRQGRGRGGRADRREVPRRVQPVRRHRAPAVALPLGIPVLAFTPEPSVRSQLAMTWGIETFLGPEVEHTDEMVLQVDKALLDIGRCEEGDLVVIVAGSPPGIPGSTNALRIHRMGDAINGAAPAYRSIIDG